MPFDKTIDQLITEQSLKFPDKIAVKFGDDIISYQNLSKQVNQLANLLIANNISVGDKVALTADRSIEMVVALLSIMRAGAAYVPLDPNFPIDRLNFMLADSEAKLLLTAEKYAGYFDHNVNKLLIENAWPQLDTYPANEPTVTIGAHDLAYILYTSGSTGKPKGVQIEHYNLVNFLLSMQHTPGLNPDDVLLAVTTISFDIAGLELYLPLISGAKLLIADNEMVKDGRLLLDTIRSQNVTIMQATPYTWRIMLASDWNEPLPLKILCGGEALPKDLADKLVPKCSSLWNLYGPTETTIWSTVKQVSADDDLITIGKPIDETQVYILDEKLQPVANGEPGEIFISGDGVARGYLNRPELTAEKFIPDPFSSTPGQRMYSTGDLGKITPGGEILCLGRLDHQVKIRGYRIETEEVEYNLMQQPGIQNAVVLVHEDQSGTQRLIAYVVATPADVKNDTPKWISALKSKLPEYMVPTDFIQISEMPLTPNGKRDRKQLPKPVFNINAATYAEPETDTEKMIAGIWAKYLGVERLSMHDNFFAMGGHSLIAVQIMTAIGKITGKLIPIATLFKYPTIHKLAQLLRSGNEESTWRSLVPIKPNGSKIPLYIIHGEGLNVLIFNSIAMNVDEEQPIYGLQSRGLNGIDEIPDNIEALATLYIEEILEQNPVGPYAIAGYSIGGYIAIEMARQLQAMGKEIAILIMLDVNFQMPASQMSLPKLIIKKAIRQIHKAQFTLTSLLKHPATAIEYQLFMIKHRLGLLKEVEPENIPDYMQNLVDKLRGAVAGYTMKPFNGTIHLLKSKIKVYFVDDPQYLGWQPFAVKGVVAHEVPGDHHDMLLPPNDKQFARVLQQCLDSVANSFA